jgi:hypothetical protein
VGNPKFRPVKQCIFCDGPADSREDAWAIWALKRLNFPAGMRGEIDGIKHDDPRQKHLRIRCVCIPCNTGWMKASEEAVIAIVGAMMLDEPVVLDAARQRAIALWAMKLAMVFEHVQREGPIFYTDTERRRLRLTGELPSHSRVWIARLLGDGTFYTRGDHFASTPDQLPINVEGSVTTIAFRRFVAQVFTPRILRTEVPLMLVTGHSQWQHACLPVRPVGPDPQSITWPPPESISASALEDFHFRFRMAEAGPA